MKINNLIKTLLIAAVFLPFSQSSLAHNIKISVNSDLESVQVHNDQGNDSGNDNGYIDSKKYPQGKPSPEEQCPECDAEEQEIEDIYN